VLGQFVLLYRELIKLNLTPLEVDRMQMWQIGALFGDDDTPVDVTPFSQGGRDPHLRARIEAAKRGEGIEFTTVPPKGSLLSGARPVPNPQPQVDVNSPRV